jgi:predicted aspartyl protease
MLVRLRHFLIGSRLCCALAVLAPLASAAQGANAQGTASSPAAAQSDKSDKLVLVEDATQRMTMPVEIGDNGPYPFLIDTGSHRSIIATDLAQRLMLPMLPPVEIVSMSGRETVAAVQLDRISFGAQVVSDLPALSIARDDLGGTGLIGLDGLKDKRLTLDFRARKMEIGRSQSADQARLKHDTTVVQATRRLGQLILSDANIEGRAVNLILDTGAEMSIGNMALYRNLRMKRLVIPPTKAVLISITGELVPAQFTIVRRLEIGQIKLNNVPMVFVDAQPFAELDLADKPAMLLGMTVLRQFRRVAIDFGNRHVDFQMRDSEELKNTFWRTFASRTLPAGPG